jgi:hypothetical protein
VQTTASIDYRDHSQSISTTKHNGRRQRREVTNFVRRPDLPPVTTFDSIPLSATIFLDANILIYPSRALWFRLRRCSASNTNSTGDALISAVMQDHGSDNLASVDDDFDRVTGTVPYAPA